MVLNLYGDHRVCSQLRLYTHGTCPDLRSSHRTCFDLYGTHCIVRQLFAPHRVGCQFVRHHSVVGQFAVGLENVRLAEKFPDCDWKTDGSDTFAQRWLAHASSWDTVLAAWDSEFSTMWPGIPQPFAGLLSTVDWCV